MQHQDEAQVPSSVLVVDDDEGIRTLLVDVLRGAGYIPAIATNGEEALAYLRSHSLPGVILLDLVMPRMDGWTFRREQRADHSIAAVPIIVTTDVSREEQKVNTMRAVAYLEKPFNLKLLLHLVGLYCTPQRSG